MDTVQKVKDKLSIVDVVTPYVKLTRSGKYLRGLSPFNKEKTPSFFVSPDKGSFYCFSSSKGGDIFTFTEMMEGVDFRGALKILAEKAGVEIVEERPQDRAKRGQADRLREALARAESYYSSLLDPSGPAYAYARARGLTAESIAFWNLGLAPSGWRGLLEKLSEEGYTTVELLAAGLIKEADEKKGTYYDRFRNRLMFPIRDSSGRTVAFTGRALDPADQAKYLNSPETDLYKKHEVLFGMDKAKDAIRTRGFALLVEGQMDLLMLHQIGFTNTIALSGTALSREHLGLVKRYADNLMLALDADRAGLAASMKSALAAFAAEMRVKAIQIPAGKDPADMAVADPKDFIKRVADAESIVEFFLQVLQEAEKDHHRLILRVEETVLPLINAIKSPLEREHFVGLTARALMSTPEAVRAGLQKAARELAGSTVGTAAAERVSSGASIPSGLPLLRPEKLSESAQRALDLRALLASCEPGPLAERIKSEYYRIIGSPLPDEPIPLRSIFEAGLAFGEAPAENAADDLIRAFESSVLKERYQEAIYALRKAEAARDDMAISAAASACQELSRELARFSH